MIDQQSQFNDLHNHDGINSQKVTYKNIAGTPVIPDPTVITVSDGVTTVSPVTEIDFTGATVTDLGGGIAEVDVTGGGGSPGGNADDIQTNDGVGGFAGSDNFQWLSDTTLKTQVTYKLNGTTTFGGGTVVVNVIDTTTSVNVTGTVFLELKACIVTSAGIMTSATGAQVIRAVYTYNTSGPTVTQQVSTTDFTFGNTSASFTDNGTSIIQISLPGIFLQQWAYEVTYFFV